MIVAPLGNGSIDVRDRALILIGFAGALPHSELVARDVGKADADGRALRIRRSNRRRGPKVRFEVFRTDCSGTDVVVTLRPRLDMQKHWQPVPQADEGDDQPGDANFSISRLTSRVCSISAGAMRGGPSLRVGHPDAFPPPIPHVVQSVGVLWETLFHSAARCSAGRRSRCR
jgi:hypothetical protein